jgi:colanic acid biosynthesis glycosyl transferase WcaI
MRITIIGINYAPEVTGIAPYTTGIAEGLAERGHDVTVVTGMPHYPAWRVDEDFRDGPGEPQLINGVRVCRVNHHVPGRSSALGRIRMEASFAGAAARVSWSRPDLVLAISPTLLSAARVVSTCRARGIPTGVVVQDIYSSAVVETGQMGGQLARLTARLEAGTLRRASSVAVIHDRFIDTIAAIGVDRGNVRVIRNWTHLNDAPGGIKPAEMRVKLGWRQDEQIVLHSGNMGAKQGLENVINAARLVDAGGTAPGMRFVLMGNGNQRPDLERLSEGVRAVDILDPVPTAAFRAVLGAADVLLVNELPGLAEMAVPSKLTSYFVTGKPVLAATNSRSATAAEVTMSGGGTVVEPGQPEALVRGVRAMLSDPAACERMGQAGRMFALNTLDRDVAIQGYDEWCHDLAGIPQSLAL